MRALGLRGQGPQVALVTALLVEVALIGALLVAPDAGFGAATGVLLVYTVGVSRLDPDGGCHCFGATEFSTRRVALIRNVCLASLGATGAALYGSRAVDIAPASQASLGVALILVLALCAVEVVSRLLSSQERQPTYGGAVPRCL